MISNLLLMLSNEPDSARRSALMHDWLEDNPNTYSQEELEELFFQYLVNVTREKLVIVRNTTNIFKAVSLKTDLVNWLKLFVSDKQDIQKLIEIYSTEIKENEVYNLRQLRSIALEHKDNYLVQGLFRKGVLFLVAGAPKTGKSLLATNLGVCLIQGTPFLNRATLKSRVVFIQNEEPLPGTYHRIYNNGLQFLEASQPELFEELLDSHDLIVAKHLDLSVDKASIVKVIEDHEADVLIVDSLGASIRRSGLTEYSTELIPLLYEWQDYAHTHNVNIFILHHTTKMNAGRQSSDESKAVPTQTRLIGATAGHNGIMRANDGAVFLQPGKTPGTVVLYTIPRDGVPEELLLEHEEDEASFWNFKVKKENTLTSENIQLQNSVLRLLLEQYNLWQESDDEKVYGYTLTELMDILGVPRPDLVKRLNQMTDTQGISRRTEKGRFIYHIPANGESWLLAYLEIEEAEQAKAQQQLEIDARMANAVRNTRTREEFLQLLQGWSDEEKKRVFNLIDPQTRIDKMLLVNPPRYSVGASVRVEGIEVQVSAVTLKDGKHMYTIQDSQGNQIPDYLEEQLEG
jgi:archaellum biogenesis ATPase FlaH